MAQHDITPFSLRCPCVLLIPLCCPSQALSPPVPQCCHLQFPHGCACLDDLKMIWSDNTYRHDGSFVCEGVGLARIKMGGERVWPRMSWSYVGWKGEEAVAMDQQLKKGREHRNGIFNHRRIKANCCRY